MDIFTMQILLCAAALGVIPGYIAQKKGHSFFRWWLYGTLVFPLGLIGAVLLDRDQAGVEEQQIAQGMKKCSFCAEMIQGEARVCRYCGREVQQLSISSTLLQQDEVKVQTKAQQTGEIKANVKTPQQGEIKANVKTPQQGEIKANVKTSRQYITYTYRSPEYNRKNRK